MFSKLKMKDAAITFLLVGLATLAAAEHSSAIDMYLSERDQPIEIKKDNIFSLVIDQETNMPQACGKGFFLKFFSPWCPHCQNMAAAWTEFHNNESHHVHVVSVDCTADDSRQICSEFSIQHYPTLVYCPPYDPANPNTGGKSGKERYGCKAYNGERTATGFTSFYRDGYKFVRQDYSLPTLSLVEYP